MVKDIEIYSIRIFVLENNTQLTRKFNPALNQIYKVYVHTTTHLCSLLEGQDIICCWKNLDKGKNRSHIIVWYLWPF